MDDADGDATAPPPPAETSASYDGADEFPASAPLGAPTPAPPAPPAPRTPRGGAPERPQPPILANRCARQVVIMGIAVIFTLWQASSVAKRAETEGSGEGARPPRGSASGGGRSGAAFGNAPAGGGGSGTATRWAWGGSSAESPTAGLLSAAAVADWPLLVQAARTRLEPLAASLEIVDGRMGGGVGPRALLIVSRGESGEGEEGVLALPRILASA
jgi:hypothetical protein